MNKLIQSDKKKRINYLKFEKKKFILKNIFKNINFISLIRFNSFLLLANFPRSSYKTQIKNRCILTGRRSILNKKYRFSRLIFMELARNGFISGIKNHLKYF